MSILSCAIRTQFFRKIAAIELFKPWFFIVHNVLVFDQKATWVSLYHTNRTANICERVALH